jgi:23S rRNA (uracil1939-C5)-methyltransferase
MEFSFSQNKAGDRFLGLIIKSSRGKVFNLQECLLASPWFSTTLAGVREWWHKTQLPAFNFRSGQGTVRNLTLRESRRTQQRLVMLTVSGDPNYPIHRSQLTSFVEAIGDPHASIFLRVQQCIKGKPTQFYELHLRGPDHITEELDVLGQTFTFKISPTSFFQPNTEQAQHLYTHALKLVTLSKETHVWDLYCGTATIGMTIAPHVRKVTAIELNPHAVFDAKANAEYNNISNIEIICGDVGQVLKTSSFDPPDIVILDPPRMGLDPLALEMLQILSPKQILYISCNPETQAKNIAELTNYTIQAIQPIDQFPHTRHIENIVVLNNLSFVTTAP